MSWLARRSIRKMVDPADGTLTVTATSAPPTAGDRTQNFLFTGVVQAPGLPSTAVEVTGLVAPADRWPGPGSTLPVVVDRAHPQHLVVRWDEVPTVRSLAWQQAQIDALKKRTGIDAVVLEQAMALTEGTHDGPPAYARPPAPVPSAAVHPESPTAPVVGAGAPAAGPAVVVAGTVVAVRDVALPPGLAPAGGIVDLTIRLDATGAVVFARERCEDVLARARVGSPGAVVRVLVDATHPDVVTLVSPAEPSPY